MANPIRVIQGLIDSQRQLGEFIRDGPDGGLPGYVRDRYRDRCDQFANIPGWVLALSPVGRQSINNWCEPYWEDGGFDGPEFEPPFVGGQCPEIYQVWATVNGTDVQVGGQSPRDIEGPLGGVQRIETLLGTPFPDSTRYQFIFSGPNDGPEVTARASFDPDVSFRIDGIVGGGEDDCGDPPPEFRPGPNPPPDPGPLPGPEPTDDPIGGPFPDFPIPPWPGPLFDYPIVDPLPEGDGAGEPETAPGGDGVPGDGGAIGGTVGTANGNNDGQDFLFGEPPEGRVWVGCLLRVTTNPLVGNIPGTGPISTVWPTVRGNVALKYPGFYGTSHRVNSRFQEVYRPVTSLIVEGCFVKMQPGSSARIFPVSAPTCPDNPCEVTNG